MDFNKPWTASAVEAEIDTFGAIRIVEAHNEIVERLERNRDAALERAQAALVHAELDSFQRGYVHDIIAALKGELEEIEEESCPS